MDPPSSKNDMNIRPATVDDIASMLEVKRQLMFQEANVASTTGGFLLGSDEQGYRIRIAQNYSWVLEDEGVKGFSIILPDQALRASEIWQRRTEIEWNIDHQPIEKSTLGYFDQLAVVPGPWRSFAPVLAIVSILDFLQSKPDYLFSSTVIKPVQNLAAVPYLQFLGGTCVGVLDEEDPIVGQLVSNIWLAPCAGLTQFINQPPTAKIAGYIVQATQYLHRHRNESANT